MNDAAYRKRLAADLPGWTDAKWVSPEGAAAILATLDGNRRRSFGLPAIVATLGALLIDLGIIAFVAANWEAIPRVLRLVIIVAVLAAAYACAWRLDRRNARGFAEASLLVAGLVFAAGIALVGQAYHMAGDFAGAVMLFEAGIFGAALATGSPALAVLGLIGAGYWTWLATVDAHVIPHYPSLVAILLGLAIATAQNAHAGRVLAVVVFMFWVTISVFGLAERGDWELADGMVVLVGAVLALWAFGAALATAGEKRLAALGGAILWPALFAILLGLGVLQLAEDRLSGGDPVLLTALVLVGVAVVCAALAGVRKGLTLVDVAGVAVLGLGAVGYALYMPEGADAEVARQIAGSVLALLACLWAVSLGQSGRHPVGKSLGLAAFGLEVLYLYVFLIGTQMDTALAFIGGGVLFVILAFVLFRVDRALERRRTGAPPAGTPPDTGSAVSAGASTGAESGGGTPA